MIDRWAFGLDLGQVTDFAALSLIHERTTKPGSSGQPVLLPEPIHDVPALHRWKLGTSYTRIIASTVRRVGAVLADQPGAAVYLVVDGTGVGRGVVDGLADALAGVNAELIAVIITSGNAPRFDLREDGAQEWHVPKKDLIGATQVLLQDGRLNIARGLAEAETLVAELQNFRMKITLSANAQFEAHREGQHDDLVLSVAIGSWALLHGPLGQPFEASVGGSRPTIEYR